MNQNKIPNLDLSQEIEFLWDELMCTIEKVLKSSQFILGPNVKSFEDEVAKYLGVKYAIGVNSGTDALIIGLSAAGIGPGHEVITTPFTFFATSEAINQVGADPVFVDINPNTLNIDSSLIEDAITKRTRAILPVHLYGQAADMDDILALAHKYELKVIEDTAQAFGGEYRGQKLGTIGDVGCYSFFPSKNLGAYGDGGLITTNNKEIAQLAEMLRGHGAKYKYYNEIIGYNSRLDEIQAAILRVKLPYIDKWNEARREIAQYYNTLLRDIEGINIPYEAPNAYHVYHQYTIQILNNKRNMVKQFLDYHGIGNMVYYPMPLYKLPVYAHLNYNLPKTQIATDQVLSLPIWPHMSRDYISKVSDLFNMFF